MAAACLRTGARIELIRKKVIVGSCEVSLRSVVTGSQCSKASQTVQENLVPFLLLHRNVTGIDIKCPKAWRLGSWPESRPLSTEDLFMTTAAATAFHVVAHRHSYRSVRCATQAPEQSVAKQEQEHLPLRKLGGLNRLRGTSNPYRSTAIGRPHR